jgi:hypothetical protein
MGGGETYSLTGTSSNLVKFQEISREVQEGLKRIQLKFVKIERVPFLNSLRYAKNLETVTIEGSTLSIEVKDNHANPEIALPRLKRYEVSASLKDVDLKEKVEPLLGFIFPFHKENMGWKNDDHLDISVRTEISNGGGSILLNLDTLSGKFESRLLWQTNEILSEIRNRREIRIFSINFERNERKQFDLNLIPTHATGLKLVRVDFNSTFLQSSLHRLKNLTTLSVMGFGFSESFDIDTLRGSNIQTLILSFTTVYCTNVDSSILPLRILKLDPAFFRCHDQELMSSFLERLEVVYFSYAFDFDVLEVTEALLKVRSLQNIFVQYLKRTDRLVDQPSSLVDWSRLKEVRLSLSPVIITRDNHAKKPWRAERLVDIRSSLRRNNSATYQTILDTLTHLKTLS